MKWALESSGSSAAAEVEGREQTRRAGPAASSEETILEVETALYCRGRTAKLEEGTTKRDKTRAPLILDITIAMTGA